MSSSWGEGFVLDVTAPDASWVTESELSAESGDWAARNWGESADEFDEASVGQWLANIGSGAATGAATGMVAGPWGALVGGLLGGGLGAVQTAMAPQPAPTRAPAPPARPAAPPPVAAPRPAPVAVPARPPSARPLSRPATPVAGATDLGTTQLLDQLAALVPVVAALALQVGQLSQAGRAPGGAEQAGMGDRAGSLLGGGPESDAWQEADDEQDLDGCGCDRSGRSGSGWGGSGWGESGEAALTEGAWSPGSSGEWIGPAVRDDDNSAWR